jgi:tellurite resistance protein TerC
VNNHQQEYLTIPPGYWILFNLFVVTMLILDLVWFHRRSREVKIREALAWTVFWIILAMAFNYGVYRYAGREAGLEFLTAYLIEKSLSLDNIFVFVMIFSSFSVLPEYQHKVLFWGIFGALVMRIIFIYAGVAIIHRFHGVIYVFSVFLVYTGIRMLLKKHRAFDPEKSRVIRLFRRFIPVTSEYHGGKFFVKENGRTIATPLVIVLLMIEMSDIIFAVDSIPAILAVSDDVFIVYTSNVFAILGLRSLYFALSGLYGHFRFLKYGLALILVFVGVKLFVSDFFKMPTYLALAVIAGILAASVLFSILMRRRKRNAGV